MTPADAPATHGTGRPAPTADPSMHQASALAERLAATVPLVWMMVRRDRVRIAVWVVAIVVMVAVSAASTIDLFPTQQDLDRVAAASDNPAIIAFNGPPQALDTIGGQVAFQIGAPGLVFVALMSLLMVGRLTRTEEEAGRLELVRSLPVGRLAPLAAAGIVVAGMNVAIVVLLAPLFVALDLDVAGSLVFATAFGVLGLVFVGISLVTAQVSDSPRLANGLAGCVLALAYVLRAIGDMRAGTESWFSPIGWVQKARPWADERWWPLALALVVAVGLAGVAAALLERRDLGAGLVAPRPGRPTASARLRSPLALALRLQRGSVIAWAAGVAVTGVAYGSVTDAIEQFVADNPDLADLLTAAGGGSLVERYLATAARITTLIGSGFAVQSVLRLRSAETALLAEPVLATTVSRRRWAGAHLGVAAAGAAVVASVAGVALGTSAALVTGDRGLIGPTVGAALASVPATWVLIGVGAALFGLAPRAATATWAGLVVAFVIAMFATVLDLPSWVVDLSPFEHVPLVPAASFEVTPLVVLGGVAAVLVAAGITGYARRDLGD